MKDWFAVPGRLDAWLEARSQAVVSVFLLGLRAHVAQVFFASGLTKIADLDATIALFENEYRVPVLSPALAAYSGTAAELLLPALLVAGLLSRPTALALFAFNLVAAASYPDISAAGVKDHWLWGTMLATLVVFGAGRIAVDHALGAWRAARVRGSA